MTNIICPECKHSIKNHSEDYDGIGRCMECQNLYPDNPDDPDCYNILKWCRERPENLKLNMAIELLEKYKISDDGFERDDIVEFLEGIK
jgi:hypothetical protein